MGFVFEKDVNTARNELVDIGRSLFERGLTPGTSGNISVRLQDGWLMTPTKSCMGKLEASLISRLDKDWNHLSGDKPTKEVFLHKAMYEARPSAGAIVHLHSPYALAVSCLYDIDPQDVLPAMTPYAVMSFGTLRLIPYYRPGDKAMGDVVSKLAKETPAILLANHGPVVAGTSLRTAANAAEEIEQAARLKLTLQGRKISFLTDEQQDDLRRHFPLS